MVGCEGRADKLTVTKGMGCSLFRVAACLSSLEG
jgi:hypothetical protein